MKDGPEACQKGCECTRGAAAPQLVPNELSFGGLPSLGSRWVLQSLAPFGDDLIWVLTFFPHEWALICLVSGPSPLGLMSGDVTPCPITYLGVVSLLFRHVLM